MCCGRWPSSLPPCCSHMLLPHVSDLSCKRYMRGYMFVFFHLLLGGETIFPCCELRSPHSRPSLDSAGIGTTPCRRGSEPLHVRFFFLSLHISHGGSFPSLSPLSPLFLLSSSDKRRERGPNCYCGPTFLTEVVCRLAPVPFNCATECFEYLFNNLTSELNSSPEEQASMICDSLTRALHYLLSKGFVSEPLATKMMVIVGVTCLRTLQSQSIVSSARQQLVGKVIAPWMDRLLSHVDDAIQQPSQTKVSLTSFPFVWVLLRFFADTVPEAKLR